MNCITEWLNTLPKLQPNNISSLLNSIPDTEFYTLYSDIPERVQPDLFIALVNYWNEFSDLCHKPLRIYSIVYNLTVEKYILRLVNKYNNIYLTILPGDIRYMKDVSKAEEVEL